MDCWTGFWAWVNYETGGRRFDSVGCAIFIKGLHPGVGCSLFQYFSSCTIREAASAINVPARDGLPQHHLVRFPSTRICQLLQATGKGYRPVAESERRRLAAAGPYMPNPGESHRAHTTTAFSRTPLRQIQPGNLGNALWSGTAGQQFPDVRAGLSLYRRQRQHHLLPEFLHGRQDR